MKQLLKYLIPFILIAVFLDTAGNSVSADHNSQIFICQIESVEISSDTSGQDSDRTLPKKSSFSNQIRTKNCVRRLTGIQRNTIDFIKIAKTVKALTSCQNINNNLIHSSKTEHTHRLASLGKLLM